MFNPININKFEKTTVELNLSNVEFTITAEDVTKADGTVVRMNHHWAIISKGQGFKVSNEIVYGGYNIVLHKLEFDAAMDLADLKGKLNKAIIRNRLREELKNLPEDEFNEMADGLVDNEYYAGFVATIEFEPMLKGKYTAADGTEKTREHSYIRTNLVSIKKVAAK